MPRCWRLVSAAHADHAFDGEGARLYGGRWNSPGLPVVYTSGSQALAVLEILVHLSGPSLRVPFVLFGVDVPESAVADADPAARLWVASPSIRPETQRLGDTWIRSGASLALRVPSAILPDEPNLLLNPAHPDFSKLRIGPPIPFALDPRLPGL